jgi:hypothetical protein
MMRRCGAELSLESRGGIRIVTSTHCCQSCLACGSERPDTPFWRGWGAMPLVESPG